MKLKTGSIITLVSLTAVAALIVGLAVHINRQIILIKAYCFKIINLKINKVAINDVDIDLTLKVRNQSDLNLVIKQYQFKIYIDGYYVCEVLNQNDILFAAATTSMLPIKVKFNPQGLGDSMKLADAIALVSKFVTSRDSIAIKMDGTVSVKHSFVALTVPLNISMTIKEIMTSDPNALPCQV